MQQFSTILECKTSGIGLFEITDTVPALTRESGIATGLLTLFIQHTSASLTIQENADPTVQPDLVDALERLAPMDSRLYRHTAEGEDDMPAHIKSALTDVSLSIPVIDGRATLGTWQGIYVFEHRKRPHVRKITVLLQGETS